MIRTALRRQGLLRPGERVLVAVSGGQDSLTLCEALSQINLTHGKGPRWQKLELAHCDHGWPGDAGIASHVASYAKIRKLPLHMITADPPPRRTENDARVWRYAALEDVALRKGFDTVATGHTRTDLAETVVHALAGGAGPDGLVSLSWRRTISGTSGVGLVRPMLDVSREETARFCTEKGIAFWRDEYNETLQYARNRVRRVVMPVMRDALNGEVERALARTAHLLRDEAAEMERVADGVYERAVRVAAGGVWILREVMQGVGVGVRRRVLRRVLREVVGTGHEGKMFEQVEEILRLVFAPVGTRAASLSGRGAAFVADEGRIAVRVGRYAKTEEDVDKEDDGEELCLSTAKMGG